LASISLYRYALACHALTVKRTYTERNTLLIIAGMCYMITEMTRVTGKLDLYHKIFHILINNIHILTRNNE
jgi:hypothetical protein